jgi:hypothetical protein
MNVGAIIAGVIIIAFSIGSLYYITSINNAINPIISSVPTTTPAPTTAPTPVKEETEFTNKPWCRLGMHGEKPMCVKVPSSDLCGSGVIYIDEKECNSDRSLLGML